LATEKERSCVNTQEAVRFLNNDVAWEPGVTVQAAPALPFKTGISVQITMAVIDSSSVREDGTYPSDAETELQSGFSLLPYEYETREKLLYRMIREIAKMHEHDTREFTRVRDESGRWVAPFHPHREDGDELWNHGGRKTKESA
jgi:hypothetical protein